MQPYKKTLHLCTAPHIRSSQDNRDEDSDNTSILFPINREGLQTVTAPGKQIDHIIHIHSISLILKHLTCIHYCVTEPKSQRAIFPLWTCGNAMRLNHDCLHLKFSDCYRHPQHRSSRNKKRAKYGVCDHKVLQPFDNEEYYRNPYYDTMDDEQNFPKKCVKCNEYIYAMRVYRV